MLPLPPVELPEKTPEECRALMVIVPVLTDPPKWKRRQRRSSVFPLICQASVVPLCLAIATLGSVWLITSGQDMMPLPVRQSFEHWVAVAETVGHRSMSTGTPGMPLDQ